MASSRLLVRGTCHHLLYALRRGLRLRSCVAQAHASAHVARCAGKAHGSSRRVLWRGDDVVVVQWRRRGCVRVLVHGPAAEGHGVPSGMAAMAALRSRWC